VYVRQALRTIDAAAAPGAPGDQNGQEQHDGDALSLSVEPTNLRAIALYERLGFARVGENGGSWTMRRDCHSGEGAAFPKLL
jgi:ribosomal protein S18 acetylase RimI-like enzyme